MNNATARPAEVDRKATIEERRLRLADDLGYLLARAWLAHHRVKLFRIMDNPEAA